MLTPAQEALKIIVSFNHIIYLNKGDKTLRAKTIY